MSTPLPPRLFHRYLKMTLAVSDVANQQFAQEILSVGRFSLKFPQNAEVLILNAACGRQFIYLLVTPLDVLHDSYVIWFYVVGIKVYWRSSSNPTR